MFRTSERSDPARMKNSTEGRSTTIHIGLDDGEPPTGTVMGEDAVPVPFADWLELMHAISRLASRRPPETAESHRIH